MNDGQVGLEAEVGLARREANVMGCVRLHDNTFHWGRQASAPE